MTDRKISELVAVTSVDDADEFVLARSGSSNKITGANMGSSFGGSLPDEWSVDAHGNLVITPTSSFDPATGEGVPTVKLVAPATYASYGGPFSGLYGIAVTPGAAGNAIGVDIVPTIGETGVTLTVVGTTLSFAVPEDFTSVTWDDLVDAATASPAATALATFSAPNPGPVDGAISDSFSGGHAGGGVAYIAMRLAGNHGASWFINADAGLDIQLANGDFVGQIDINGAYFRGQPGGDALTAVDSDYNNLIQANASGVGFNGATPAVPVIAATPDAQAVVDALVALGLVTQAA